MKCLLLAPLRYPFVAAIRKGLEGAGWEVHAADFPDLNPHYANRLYDTFSSLPRTVRRHWEDPYVQRTNAAYLRTFMRLRPDLVFIYNDQLLLPATVELFAEKARVAFFLGDNPLYTPTNIHNLHILYRAHYIIAPDTLWRDQLRRMGIDTVVFDHFGFDEEVYHPMEPTAADRAALGADLVYIGSGSKTNWGYKRARFLHLFAHMDLKAWISGGGIDRWYPLFPGLEQRVIAHQRFDAGFNNRVYNCGKVAPVELVPSLFHGIHVRVFDTLGAGILPLCEDSADLRTLFAGLDPPMITDYRGAAELAAHWIADDRARADLAGRMRVRVRERFNPSDVIGRLNDQLFPAWH
jgi:hypothetical protein